MSTSPPPGATASGHSPRIAWGLVTGLGAVALLRPLLRITGVVGDDGVLPSQVGALGATALITVVWVLVVGLSRVPRPFLTLVLAGLAYAILSTLLSGVLSPLLDGRLEGPLANPIAIPMMLASNAVWGAVAGALALALRAATGRNTQGPVV